MSPEPPPPDDPLLGNSLSGLLDCALGTPLPPSETPEITHTWEPPTPVHIALLLPQYQIEHLIGRGGMGAVYKGRQTTLNRPVAIKLLPPELARSQDFVGRFQREAQLLASLSHPGIVTIFDFGQTTEGHLYFVMEYVDGTDLYRLIHKSDDPLQPAQTLSLAMQICEAMQYAHDMGVVHRDIKPANVLVTRDGRAKLADFGLAMKPADSVLLAPEAPMPQGFELGSPTPSDVAALRFTRAGLMMGTPPYAAPELYEGHADERSDIFALGIMFYEMLTGQVPEQRYLLPSQKVEVDSRVDDVVVRALEAEPDSRFQKASEMRRAVELATRPLSKAPPIPPQRLPSSATVKSQASAHPSHAPYRPPASPQPPRRSRGFGRTLLLLMAGTAVAVAAYDAGRQWAGFHSIVESLTKAGTGLTGGQLDEARHCLAQAKALLPEITDPVQKTEVEAAIAPAIARLGDAASAMKAAEAITAPEMRFEAFANIALALCRLENYRAALAAAMRITDPDLREQTLASMAESQLAAGSMRQWAEVTGLIITPAGKASLLAVVGQGQWFAGAKDKALLTLAAAREQVANAPESKGKVLAQRRIVVALARAGEYIRASSLAMSVNEDVRGDPRGQIAVVQAEKGEYKAALETAASLPSAWARGVALGHIARRQAAKGLMTEAKDSLKFVPYDDLRAQGQMNLCILANDVTGAKAALENIRKDLRNLPEAEIQHGKALPNVAVLMLRVDGLASASKWLALQPKAAIRAMAWIAMSGARFPADSPVPPPPGVDLATLNALARPAPAPAPVSPTMPKDDETGFVALFDAAHKGGWHHVGAGGFTEREGVFTSWSPGPDRWGLLWYSGRQFKDFTLRFDLMVDSGEVNSGVYLRLPMLGSYQPELYFSSSYEMEILGEETGAIPHVRPRPNLLPALKIGGWNQCEITVIKQDYTFKVNGKIVQSYSGDRNTAGYIALQNKTSRGAASFRNLRIKERITGPSL